MAAVTFPLDEGPGCSGTGGWCIHLYQRLCATPTTLLPCHCIAFCVVPPRHHCACSLPHLPRRLLQLAGRKLCELRQADEQGAGSANSETLLELLASFFALYHGLASLGAAALVGDGISEAVPQQALEGWVVLFSQHAFRWTRNRLWLPACFAGLGSLPFVVCRRLLNLAS